ncbi:hypothetical protein PRIPAC_89631 [Pristionchus pacificus]|uniref:Uncharacterized protein n=1 Tax=Pristionchus pacificus TaxID=54126 RepID=A0A2A6B7H0_PRIPA|nr:hypothetical protein PRIPAC_89631 [Pristionchus pacificus]|eukprot:PDM61839.1 hypothetical protein PRIPAC_51281 [Pristionchus pacificus]
MRRYRRGAMSAQFDPNDGKYFHLFCCSSHVTKAARYIAYLSLCSLFARSVVLISDKQWSSAIGWNALFEFLCTISLIYAVSDEVAILALPYLIHQAYCFGTLAVDLAEMSRNWDRQYYFSKFPSSFYATYNLLKMFKLFETRNIEQTEKVLAILTRLSRLVVAIYFFKVILNFFLFLKRRYEANRKYARYSMRAREERKSVMSASPASASTIV